jgi:uridine kinase
MPNIAKIEISEINRLAKLNPLELIRVSEERYKSFTDEIATRVAENENIRIILLAGPSGSGKTTTANLLADGIRKKGLFSTVISLDDFYRSSDDKDYPRLENGERDFEAVEALNLSDIEKTLVAISEGKEFVLPKYDFKLGRRTNEVKMPKISHGCVIIEGLHALNPLIFEHLDMKKVLRIFISVSTNVNKNGERILSGRKIRFMRRMIRDSLYRASDAENTLSLWENVLLGEDKNLYPFRKYADIQFDTFHAFEIGVMKPYVKALISSSLSEKNEYAKTVLLAANEAVGIDESLVPADSLIREFIEGGKYEEFY